MRISDWSSDVCSSDLWPQYLEQPCENDPFEDKVAEVGQSQQPANDESGLLTEDGTDVGHLAARLRKARSQFSIHGCDQRHCGPGQHNTDRKSTRLNSSH